MQHGFGTGADFDTGGHARLNLDWFAMPGQANVGEFDLHPIEHLLPLPGFLGDRIRADVDNLAMEDTVNGIIIRKVCRLL